MGAALFEKYDQRVYLSVKFRGTKIANFFYQWRGIMNKSDQDEGFIGPIKPLMSMSYRDYLHMINTGLGLPRFPRQKAPIIKKDQDYLFPPVDYKLN